LAPPIPATPAHQVVGMLEDKRRCWPESAQILYGASVADYL